MDLIHQSITLAELIATITGLIAVWFTIKENRWCFPLGIISSGIYAIIFFSPSVRFYADAFLQLVYVVLLIYGWVLWSPPKPNLEKLTVSKLSSKQRITCSLLLLIATLGIGIFLKAYTDASMPFLDAFTTSLSLIAQWMVARKKIENWHIWILANVLFVYMYVQKDLHITAVYYVVLLILAFAGLWEWKKQLSSGIAKQNQVVNPNNS